MGAGYISNLFIPEKLNIVFISVCLSIIALFIISFKCLDLLSFISVESINLSVFTGSASSSLDILMIIRIITTLTITLIIIYKIMARTLIITITMITMLATTLSIIYTVLARTLIIAITIITMLATTLTIIYTVLARTFIII